MSIFNRYQEVLKKDWDFLDEVMPYINLYGSRMHFTKMLEQYEIYKLAMHRPGHIVELGVYRGESFFNWARFVEAHNMGERETRIIGFDSFTGFTNVSEKDISAANRSEASLAHEHGIKVGGFDPGERALERIKELIEIFENDHFVPQKRRLELVVGDVTKTIPQYVEEHPGLRISLLHLDVDLYEPTLIGLKYLFPLVVSGGVIVLDEYGQEKFAGESAAFDDYFGKKRPKVTKSRLVSNPSAYFIKEG
jgi:hypothetical protein